MLYCLSCLPHVFYRMRMRQKFFRTALIWTLIMSQLRPNVLALNEKGEKLY